MPPRLSSPACWWPGLGELRTAWRRSWKTHWLQGMERAGEVMPEIGFGVSFPKGTLRSCRPRYDTEGPTLDFEMEGSWGPGLLGLERRGCLLRPGSLGSKGRRGGQGPRLVDLREEGLGVLTPGSQGGERDLGPWTPRFWE